MLPAVNNCGSVSETLKLCKETDIIGNSTDAGVQTIKFVDEIGDTLASTNKNTDTIETFRGMSDINNNNNNDDDKNLKVRFYELVSNSRKFFTNATEKKSDAPLLLLSVPNTLEKKKSNDEQPMEREKWSRKTEFLLAIIGFSVDLGNVWRFPKVVYDNGGGRFMIPYFIQLILCGIPLFYMELVLGQFHQTGLFTLWEKICPLLKGLAFAAVVVNILLAMFYNTVIAWAVYYLYLSFRRVVPWYDCDNAWNTDCCFPLNLMKEIKEGKNSFYNVTDKGLIYRRVKNKLILFNNKDMSQFDQYNELFNSSLVNYSVKNASNEILGNESNRELMKWLKLYNINLNQTIINAPIINSSPDVELGIKFDTKIASELIDSTIGDMYKDISYTTIINCSSDTISPTQEFYSRYLTEMHKSRGLEDIGGIKIEVAFCLFLVFVTVYFALWKGIKSAGKMVWITAIAPYVVMIILLIRGLMLDGWKDGVEFYLGVKDWSSIFEFKVWVDAAAQIFFSLGPGFGTIIALSSYNKKSNNCYKDALLTSSINCLTSVLSGFVVFTTLGHMAKVQGKSVENVIQHGPGLVFVTYPQAISMMPFAPFWAVIFFFMLFTLGIDSTFGGLESVITGICDSYPNTIGKKRSWFVFFLVLFCYLLALPTVTYGGPYIVHLLDAFAVTPALMFIAILEIIGVMYIYGYKKFVGDLHQMLNITPSYYWQICWRFISPAIVVFMTIITCKEMLSMGLHYESYEYKTLGKWFAITIVSIPLFLIIAYMPYRIYKTPGTFYERIRKLTVDPDEPPPHSHSHNNFVSSFSSRSRQATLQNIESHANNSQTKNDSADV